MQAAIEFAVAVALSISDKKLLMLPIGIETRLSCSILELTPFINVAASPNIGRDKTPAATARAPRGSPFLSREITVATPPAAPSAEPILFARSALMPNEPVLPQTALTPGTLTGETAGTAAATAADVGGLIDGDAVSICFLTPSCFSYSSTTFLSVVNWSVYFVMSVSALETLLTYV